MAQVTEASTSMMKLTMTGLGGMSKVFYQKYGKEALPLIAAVMSQGGEEAGKMMQQMTPAKGVKGYGEAFKAMGPALGLAMEVVELTDDRFHFKVSQCPFGLEGTSRELCEAMMAFDRKTLSTFLGQEAQLDVLKAIAVGDKICDIVESKKK